MNSWEHPLLAKALNHPERISPTFLNIRSLALGLNESLKLLLLGVAQVLEILRTDIDFVVHGV